MSEASQLYVYFNKKGELISKAPYIENTSTVRQGEDFVLNILFDKDFLGEDDFIEITFKSPGQERENLFPFISYYEKYVDDGSREIDKSKLTFYGPTEVEFDKDLTKYGIEKGKPYQCWKFYSVNAYRDGSAVLTAVDGNLEAQVTLLLNNGEQTVTKQCGTIKIFIEKTLTYTNPFNVSQYDLNRLFKEINDTVFNNYLRKGFGIHLFEINEETGELVVLAERSDDLAEGNYEINNDGELIIKI